MEDFYNRDKLDALTKLLSSVKDNKVVCVDGEWGVGKTFFCKMLEKSESESLSFTYLNAFKSDFNESPLLVLISEISRFFDGEEKNRYIDEAKKHLAPLVGKAISFGADFIPIPGASKAGDFVEEMIEGKIKNYLSVDESIEGLRKVIKSSMSEMKGKSLVIIVDELDRCRPVYSLEIIEKIKHIFDIQGMHFVLSMNKRQMLESIDHAYGISSNKESYLEKFIDQTITLGKWDWIGLDGEEEPPEVKYSKRMMEKNFSYLENERFVENLKNFLSLIVVKNGLGFRAIERIVDKCFTALLTSGFNVEENNKAHACFLVSFSFLSIYSRNEIPANTKGFSKESFAESLLVNRFVFNSNPSNSMYRYSKIRGSENSYDAEWYYGAISITTEKEASNLAKGFYKDARVKITDKDDVMKIYREWMRYFAKSS